MQRNSQSAADILKGLPKRAVPAVAHAQEDDICHRRDGLLQQLQTLPPELDPGIEGDTGEVAAGSGEAGNQPCLQRIDHERNDRYRAGLGRESNDDRVRSGDDHIGIAGHDLAGEVSIALMMPLGGIAFDDQILSFDVAQAAQLPEKSAPCLPPPVSVRRAAGMAGWKITIRGGVARCCARAPDVAATSNRPVVNSRRLIAQRPRAPQTILDRIRLGTGGA